MKILITGVNGFIGSYLCKRLCQDNGVIGIDCKDSNSIDSKLNSFRNFQWHKADLTKRLFLSEDIDIIVHAAARTPEPNVPIVNYVMNNIICTQNLIDFAIQKKVKLFVYLSAISAYGQIDSTTVDEDTPIKASTPYGMTKYIAELLLREKKNMVPSIIFRLPVVVGAGMKSGWLFNVYEKLLRGKQVYIYNGDSPYNMVHISDVCNLVLSSLNYNAGDSNLFTINCKDFMSIRQIVNTMKKYTRSKSEIVEKSTDDKGFIISTEKAMRILNFKPKPASKILTKFLEEMSYSKQKVGVR